MVLDGPGSGVVAVFLLVAVTVVSVACGVESGEPRFESTRTLSAPTCGGAR